MFPLPITTTTLFLLSNSLTLNQLSGSEQVTEACCEYTLGLTPAVLTCHTHEYIFDRLHETQRDR